LFGGLDPRTADAGVWEMLRRELPQAEIDLSAPVSNVDLVTVAGLAKSKGEARRLLTQGGIYRNGEPIDPAGSTGPDDVLAGKYIWLRRGKKTDAIVLRRQS
jgi:tyrosyl-tRNA synthetase